MTALGVLCCFALFVCLTLLASFFLPSHLSFVYMYNVNIYTCILVAELHGLFTIEVHVHVYNVYMYMYMCLHEKASITFQHQNTLKA